MNSPDYLEGLEEREKRIVGELEPRIKDLVIGLRDWELETLCSCEGHKGEYVEYPNVDIDTDPNYSGGVPQSTFDEFLLHKIIKRWNQIGNVKWEVSSGGSGVEKIKPVDTSLSLDVLQKSAKEFGLWLQNAPKALREEIRRAARIEMSDAEDEMYNG